MNSMRLYCKAVTHMTTWGISGGLIAGAIFGSILFPLAGTLYGGFYGFIAGLILGMSSGVLTGFISHHYSQADSDPVDYGWTLGTSVTIFVMVAALWVFSFLFDGNPNWVIPGIPALVASATASYASKRFAQRCLDGEFVFEKPKRESPALPEAGNP